MSRTAGITLREADVSDAGTIALLIARLAAATGASHKVRSRAADFERHGFGPRPAFRCLLAERASQAVGLSLWFYNFSSWRGDLGAFVQDLYVDDAERGSGLGRRLLAETASRSLAEGATHLRLSVNCANERARQFYAHLGFTYRDDECIYQVADDAFAALARRA